MNETFIPKKVGKIKLCKNASTKNSTVEFCVNRT